MPPDKNEVSGPTRIRAGDTVAVAVEGHETAGATVTVSVDGFIVLPLIGAQLAQGSSASELQVALAHSYSRSIEAPRVSVAVMAHTLSISALGEVTHPGKFQIDARDNVASVLALAGGLTQYADEDSIYLVRATNSARIRFRMRELVAGGSTVSSFRLRDGDLIVVE